MKITALPNLSTARHVSVDSVRGWADYVLAIGTIVSVILAGAALRISHQSTQAAIKSSEAAMQALKETEKHQKLSATPFLCVRKDYSKLIDKQLPFNTTIIELHNDGIGPAIIQEIEIEIDERVVDCSNFPYAANMHKALKSTKEYSWIASSIDKGFIPVGGNGFPFIGVSVLKELSLSDIREIIRVSDSFVVKIKYQSIYGEPFEFKL